mgnify:FL=1
MKNYYFVGGQSAAIAEVMVILREKGVPFVRLQPDKYGICSLDNEEVDRVIAQGFFPVVIGVATARKDVIVLESYRPCVSSSPLQQVALMEHHILTSEQELILYHDENREKQYPYSVEIMRYLFRLGYCRSDIEKVRACERSEQGITEAEEYAAEECIAKHRSQRGNLLVITDLPHCKYKAVLDRLFWEQSLQNVVIFTTDGKFFYAGFADVALELMNKFNVCILHLCWAEGYFSDNVEQKRIVRYIASASKAKMK